MWNSSPSQAQKSARKYNRDDKSLRHHPPIEREAPDVKKTCIKHPGRELEFLRK